MPGKEQEETIQFGTVFRPKLLKKFREKYSPYVILDPKEGGGHVWLQQTEEGEVIVVGSTGTHYDESVEEILGIRTLDEMLEATRKGGLLSDEIIELYEEYSQIPPRPLKR